MSVIIRKSEVINILINVHKYLKEVKYSLRFEGIKNYFTNIF